MLSNLKDYYKSIVMETACYLRNERQEDQYLSFVLSVGRVTGFPFLPAYTSSPRPMSRVLGFCSNTAFLVAIVFKVSVGMKRTISKVSGLK